MREISGVIEMKCEKSRAGTAEIPNPGRVGKPRWTSGARIASRSAAAGEIYVFSYTSIYLNIH